MARQRSVCLTSEFLAKLMSLQSEPAYIQFMESLEPTAMGDPDFVIKTDQRGIKYAVFENAQALYEFTLSKDWVFWECPTVDWNGRDNAFQIPSSWIN
jgi:hypothetical protein